MNREYMDQIIRRGNELVLLEQAAECIPLKSSVVRWVAAAVLGALCTLLPAVTAAQTCFSMV